MSRNHEENKSHLTRQWSFLEECYRQEKPIVARILEITKGQTLVDVGGIEGYMDNFVFAVTAEKRTDSPFSEFEKKKLIEKKRESMIGQEIVLRIVEIDREKHILKLSQKLYTDKSSDEFYVGSKHNATIISIGSEITTVDLRGIRGHLRTKKISPDHKKFIDLSPHFRLGQEITVIVTQNSNRRTCWVALPEDILNSVQQDDNL